MAVSLHRETAFFHWTFGSAAFPVNLGNEAKTKLSMYGRVSGEGKERDEIKWDQLDKIHIQCVDGMHENR
jgi:hypothetical protein